MLQKVKRVFNFSGRSSTFDFWINFIIYYIFCLSFASYAKEVKELELEGVILANSLFVNILILLSILLVNLFFAATMVRRLHDINKSGYWVILIIFIYLLSELSAIIFASNDVKILFFIVFAYIFSKKGNAAPNKYGYLISPILAP